MKERCGWTSTWFLNYDFTFLALLLTPEEEPYAPCRKRCSVHPVLKKTMCPASPALELAADESVILTWWQLRDKIRDDGFWRGLPPGDWLCSCAGPIKRRPATARILMRRCGHVWRSWILWSGRSAHP